MKKDILNEPRMTQNVSVVRIDKSGRCSIETINHANPFLNSEAVAIDIEDKQSESLQALFSNAYLLVIIVEIGDSVNLSAIEYIAKISKKSGIFIIGIATMPFSFEGRKRKENSYKAIPALNETLGSLIVIHKDAFIPEIDPKLKIPEAFKFIDNVVNSVANDIIDIVTNSRNTFDDCYAEKDSGEASKAILLRRKLADSGKYDFIHYNLLLGE